jgi:adenylate kinase family enzyme
MEDEPKTNRDDEDKPGTPQAPIVV